MLPALPKASRRVSLKTEALKKQSHASAQNFTPSAQNFPCNRAVLPKQRVRFSKFWHETNRRSASGLPKSARDQQANRQRVQAKRHRAAKKCPRPTGESPAGLGPTGDSPAGYQTAIRQRAKLRNKQKTTLTRKYGLHELDGALVKSPKGM